MTVITRISVDMYLQDLLVVSVVLLGNFLIISTENGVHPDQKLSFSGYLDIPRTPQDERNTSQRLNAGQYETYQKNPEVEEVFVTSREVKQLHDPLNILEKINKTGTVHKHSITSEDFAQVTSSINASLKHQSPSTNVLLNTDSTGDEYSLSLVIVPVQDVTVNQYKKLDISPEIYLDSSLEGVKDEFQKSSIHEVEITNHLLDDTSIELNNSNSFNIISVIDTQDSQHIKNNTFEELYSSITVEEFAAKLEGCIKSYSNDAVVEWEDIKERVSNDNEVAHVLNDYHDKIEISQAVNNSNCVKSHEVNYESRMKFLKSILQACESQLKRERWHEFQNKTKELLNEINKIIHETGETKEKLKGDEKNDERNLSNDNEAKQKLDLLDVETKKEALFELKKNALLADEDEYTDCIIQNTGHEIVVDTLNDIMKIKNNCVG